MTVADPTGLSYLRQGSYREKHYAIKAREDIKIRTYGERCQEINSDFMPLAFEIYGACSPKVDKLLKDVVSKIADVTHVPYHILLSYWRMRISCTLQKYNAFIINKAFLLLQDSGGGNLHRDYHDHVLYAFD